MKLWCFLFTACVIQSGFGSNAKFIQKQRVAVASVTYAYSGIPKCSGTFVSADSLLTSATCLFCDQDCDMKVEILNPYTSEVLHYEIKEILIHEKYELEPTKNDIGLIKINGKVPPYLVMEIRDLQNSPAHFPTYYYTVKFHSGVISIQSNKTTLITNAKCSHILHSYIPMDNICVYSTSDFHFQEQNQGSPLIYEYRGKLYLTAIYVPEKQNYAGGSRIAIFERIGLEIPWINKHAKNMPTVHCQFSNQTPKKAPVTKAPPPNTIFPYYDSLKTAKVPFIRTTTSTMSPVDPFTLFPFQSHPSLDSASSKTPKESSPLSPSHQPIGSSKATASEHASSSQAYSPKASTSQAVPPHYSAKAPTSQAVPPHSYSEKAPTSQGVPPHAYSAKAPTSQGVPPHSYSEKAPTSQGVPPHSYSAKAPTLQGVPPHYSAKASTSQGVPLHYSAKAPTSQGFPPHYSAKVPTSQGVPPHYSAKAPTSQGVPPHSYSEKAPTSQGVPPHSYSAKASTSQGVPPHYSAKAPTSQGFPPHYSAKVPTSQGVPPHYSAKAPTSQGVPPHAYSAKAPTSQGVPPHASRPKPPSQYAPSTHAPPADYHPGQASYISYNPAKHHEYEEKRNLLEYNPQYYQ